MIDGIENDGEDRGYSHEPAEDLGPRRHHVVADGQGSKLKHVDHKDAL